MDVEKEENRLQKIIKSITNAARADGKITDEEAELLESVQINVLIYDQALEDALGDGIITDEESDTLNGLKHQILNDAYDIANISEGVSEDEIKILQILLRELESED
jgi:hypothetical protein